MTLMDNLMNAASQMLGGKDGGQGSLTDMAMDLETFAKFPKIP